MELSKDLIEEAIAMASAATSTTITPKWQFNARIVPAFAIVTDVHGFAAFMVTLTDLLGEDTDLALELAVGARSSEHLDTTIFYFNDVTITE